MKETVVLLLKMLLCSGVLLGAYDLLLDRRVRFGWCRAVLLALPLLSAAIPLLRIPVWASVPVAAPVAAAAHALPRGPIPAAEPVPPVGEALLGWIYVAGVLLFAAMILLQWIGIRRLRRGATLSRTEDFTVVEVRRPVAAFSFFGSIYLWRSTPPGDRELIIAHEASHLRHGHSAERLFMETCRALLWWNPCVWIAAARLTAVHEFEADADVLAARGDRQRYMTTIFRQTFGHSPDMASGLHGSLTKKRFQMMTSFHRSRYALLRLFALLPVAGALLCSFSFTTRAASLPESPAVPADGPVEQVGVIVWHNGERLPGAIIRIDDTARGSVTDAEGTARLRVAPGSVLHVSYVGCGERMLYVRESSRGEQAFSVTLSEQNDAKPSAGDGPLFVVDGLPCETIDHIPASRIEQIEVRKDEATLAKFGEAARNGVVIISLKPGTDLPAPGGAAEKAGPQPAGE